MPMLSPTDVPSLGYAPSNSRTLTPWPKGALDTAVSSYDITSSPGETAFSYFSHLNSAYYGGCKDSPPEILVIGDSIVRFVELPCAITYCLSGGKTTDFIELTPALLDVLASVHTVLWHKDTNEVMLRQSTKLHSDLESPRVHSQA